MKLSPPHPDSCYATHEHTGAKVYACDQRWGNPAARQFYMTVRIILQSGRRQSFWLTWIIDERRFARTRDAALLDTVGILDWAGGVMAVAFPDIETAHGLSPSEAADARAEYAAFRARGKREV